MDSKWWSIIVTYMIKISGCSNNLQYFLVDQFNVSRKQQMHLVYLVNLNVQEYTKCTALKYALPLGSMRPWPWPGIMPYMVIRLLEKQFLPNFPLPLTPIPFYHISIFLPIISNFSKNIQKCIFIILWSTSNCMHVCKKYLQVGKLGNIQNMQSSLEFLLFGMHHLKRRCNVIQTISKIL